MSDEAAGAGRPVGDCGPIGKIMGRNGDAVLDAGGYMVVAAGVYLGVALPSVRGLFKVYAPDGEIVGMFRSVDEAAAALRSR